jgi:hypothetical protein
MYGGAIKRSGEWRANRCEPLPTVEDADHLMTTGGRAVHHGTNGWVQAWAVAATGQDANLQASAHRLGPVIFSGRTIASNCSALT